MSKGAYQINDAEQRALDTSGWVYCYTCQDWHDDTYCWPQDHSWHCGHSLKPTGDDWIPDAGTMVLTCSHGGKAL